MKTYHITTETADLIRAAAPKFGMVASAHREVVAPGVEAMHLDDADALRFDAMCAFGRSMASVIADLVSA